MDSIDKQCYYKMFTDPIHKAHLYMVKQKYNSSYGFTKLHVDNILYLQGTSMMV